MGIESPTPQGTSLDQDLQALAKRFRNAVDSKLPETVQKEDLEQQKENIIAYLEGFEKDGELYSAHKDKLRSLITDLRNTQFLSREEMVRGIADKVASSVVTIYTAQQLETRTRETVAEKRGWVNINEALSYGLENEGQINLHIPTVFTKSPTEILHLFKEGLHVLATQLKTDPALESVTEVVGYSWIVSEHPDLVQKMGFTISEKDLAERVALASMSREDFISRYAN